MSGFFVRRPTFAIVLSLAILLAGLAVAFRLPVAQYPSIAPRPFRSARRTRARTP